MARNFGKVFALMLFVFGAIFTVSAQDEMTNYDEVDPTGAHVVFWHQHSGGRQAVLDEIIAEFNETNEWGITVEGLNQGSYDDIYSRMSINLSTNEALPNLVVAYANQSAIYHLLGGLVDMNALIESEQWGLSEDEVADFFPAFYEGDVFPQYDNVRLGFPPNRSMEVMYYNIDWLNELREAGHISFDGPPQTPEQFKEAACAATANPFSGATTDTPAIGYQLSVDASRFASWTFAHGGEIFDAENNAWTLDSEGAVAAMTFLKDLFDEGCAGEIFESFGDQTNFGNGATLFTVGSSSGMPFYRDAVEAGSNHEWSVAAIPHVTEDPVMNIYGASVSIPKTTPEQELAAWLFVKYYTSADVQAEWGVASNYFPVRASSAEALADYMAADPAYKTAFDLLPFGKSEPPVAGYQQVRDQVVAPAMQAIVTNADDRPIAEILAEASELADEELELASQVQ